jgi:phosphoglycolate phosphatase
MIAAVLFDKDGTLFDFRKTWSAWSRRVLTGLAEGDSCRAAALGVAIGYDFSTGGFMPCSPVIAATPADLADVLLDSLEGWERDALIAHLNLEAARTPQVEAVPLVPLLAGLLARGIRLGVATNDSEAAASAHLTSAGIRGAFDFVAGYDSGFGAKPGPGMLRAFAEKVRLPCRQVAMVGDSRHDLLAGRRAGMQTIAVLSGMTPEAELVELADAILPDIGALPGWIAGQSH